jgi:thiol-disulfide isomerase/thioredoxin
LSLRDLQSFSVRRGTWQALPASRARVRVVSLWSLRCQPCLDELPKLTELAAEYRKEGTDVEFLFVADPPEESPRKEVEAFWRDPMIDRLADTCEASKLGDLRQRDGRKSCRLDLHGIDTLRSSTEAGFLTLSEVHLRPLTLLIDPRGTVRQVFVGSLLRRTALLRDSIERLRLRLRAQASGPAQSHAL